jgi:hypothetical protein
VLGVLLTEYRIKKLKAQLRPNRRVVESWILKVNGKTYEKRNAYRLLVGKPEKKRLPGRPRRRCAYNIRMDLAEIGWDGVG